MRLIIAFLLIALTAGAGEGAALWVNNISVNEFGMTWNYTETFTDMDAIGFRVNIDASFGDNDSFVNAWEVLRADKELRTELKSLIDREPDVRINNVTSGIEVVDIDAFLSKDVVGKTHLFDPVVNRYSTVYRWKDSVSNAGSIWFMGQANSPVTIVMPGGVDVVSISGMDSRVLIVTDHAEISGYFSEITKDRGEITIGLAKNSSYVRPEVSESEVAPQAGTNSSSAPMLETLDWIRKASIFLTGIILVIVIYVLKVKRQ